MPESPVFSIIYTRRSNEDAIIIKNYLLYKFAQKEVEKFYDLLRIFESVVSVFPKLYAKSLKGKNIRRAVLSKQLAVFYQIRKSEIFIVAIIDNRMDYSKWP